MCPFFLSFLLRPVYTSDFCRSNSMQFLSQPNGIRFQTCSKPLRYRGDKSHLVYTCDFEAATLARQKLHRVAATKIARPCKRAFRELKQPRRRRQQKRHKSAYLTMKNSIFARFARAFFIFWHLEDVLVLSTTWNDLFCSCVDNVSIWWQMFNFVFLFPKRWFQFNSRIVTTRFSCTMTLNNWKMIAETRSYIFRWRSRFRRRRVCLSSLLSIY